MRHIKNYSEHCAFYNNAKYTTNCEIEFRDKTHKRHCHNEESRAGNQRPEGFEVFSTENTIELRWQLTDEVNKYLLCLSGKRNHLTTN